MAHHDTFDPAKVIDDIKGGSVEPKSAVPPAVFGVGSLPAEALPEDPNGMITRTIELTPELALEYLCRPPTRLPDGTEIRNRKIDPNWVDEIVAWIETGDWSESYEGIALAPDGGLLEGWHRCEAVIKANRTVRVRATFNAPPGLFAVTNQGKRRNSANIMQTLGDDASAKDLASTLRMIWQYERYRAGDRRFTGTTWTRWPGISMPGQALVEVRAEHMAPAVADEHDIHRSMPMISLMRKLGGVPAAMLAWHHLAQLTWKDDPAVLAAFVEELRTGAMLAEGHPALTARNQIANMRSRRLLDKRERQFFLLVKLWTARAEGRTYKRVVFEDVPMPSLPVRARHGRRPTSNPESVD